MNAQEAGESDASMSATATTGPEDARATSGVAAGEITTLLRAWAEGSAAAEERVLQLTYPVLHRIAARRLRDTDGDISLQITEVVHETYLRLAGQRHVDWHNRDHFFAISARLVRRVLVDYLRRSNAEKRGGRLTRTHLAAVQIPTGALHPDLIALHEALEDLAEIDPAAVRLVDLRYFAGFTIDEAAELLGVGRTTAVAKWRAARAFLRQQMVGRDEP